MSLFMSENYKVQHQTHLCIKVAGYLYKQYEKTGNKEFCSMAKKLLSLSLTDLSMRKEVTIRQSTKLKDNVELSSL